LPLKAAGREFRAILSACDPIQPVVVQGPNVHRKRYRLLLLAELIAAFALPVGILGYGVVMLVMLLASAIIDQNFGYAPAVAILAMYVGSGALGLWAVGRLAVSEIQDREQIGRPWLVLVASLAGIVGWTAFVEGPIQDGLHWLWQLGYFAPVIVGIQLLIQNRRRLRNPIM